MSAAQTTATPNPTTPFAERAIDLTFQLGSGTFTNTQSNILKVTGLRVQATIQIPGAVPLQGSAQVSVWGLPLQVMNDLSSLGSMLYTSRDNQIIIEAGDVGGQMSAVFTGSIFQAYADFEAGPDAPFEIVASPGYHAQIQGATPTSYAGAVNVTTILSALCEKVGLTFQSNGVNVILSNPYLPGTLIDQIEGCIEAANLQGSIQNGVLSVWSNTATTPSSGLVLSAETGMVGYPQYLPSGLCVRSLFNPALRNGETFKVQSLLTPANGTWQSFVMTHDLASQTPGGQWFTTIQAVLPGGALVNAA
jgi:hypothetical protein